MDGIFDGAFSAGAFLLRFPPQAPRLSVGLFHPSNSTQGATKGATTRSLNSEYETHARCTGIVNADKSLTTNTLYNPINFALKKQRQGRFVTLIAPGTRHKL